MLSELDAHGFDATLTGFDLPELESLLTSAGGAREDDADLTPPAEPKSKRGEVYELGRHRLMCGDSTNEQDVETLLAGARPTAYILDPPFDLDYSPWDPPEHVRIAMVWARGHTGLRWVAERCGDPPLWGVSTLVFSGQARGWARPEWPCLVHEVVYVMRRGEQRGQKARGAPARAYGLRVTEDDRPFSFYEGLASRRNDMSWAKNPACFAVFLCMVRVDEVVYDPCAGSGASLLASDVAGNAWYGMEMNEGWCDLIRQRYADQTKQPEFAP